MKTEKERSLNRKMSLENILSALKCSMSDNLSELDEELLRDKEVRDSLTAYFVEQDVRPDLVSQITVPSLMRDYLDLSQEEKEELERFRAVNGDYIGGKGEEIWKPSKSPRINKVIRIQRHISQLLEFFDFYLENREEGETFTTSYLERNKKFNERFGTLGKSVHDRSRRAFKNNGGWDGFIELAKETNPEIGEHTSLEKVFAIDGVNQLIRLFDFYLENRKDGDVFNNSCLQKNIIFGEEFGKLAQNVVQKSQRYFRDKGKFDYLVKLTADQRPEILDHWKSQSEQLGRLEDIADNSNVGTKEEETLADAIRIPTLKKEFSDLSLENREEIERFYENHPEYVGGKGLELKAKSLNSLVSSDEGKSFLRKSRYVHQMLGLFDFYLENREEDEKFNKNFILKNKKLKEKLGRYGRNLYNRIRNNFGSDEGFSMLVELASEQRPEIKHYTSTRELLKIDGTNQLLKIFDFFLENREKMGVFDWNYVRRNSKVKEEFGDKIRLLGVRARNWLSDEGGPELLFDLAARQKPEILTYRNKGDVKKRNEEDLERERRECLVTRFLEVFDFYLENREEGEIFNCGYLQGNEKLRERFGFSGNNLYYLSRNVFGGRGLDGVLELATEKRPEIKRYASMREILLLEGPQQLLRFFDFYLENRDRGEKFSTYYLKSPKMKKRFGLKGNNLYMNCRNHLREEGGIQYMVKLAAEQRPEILDHWKYRGPKKSR
jgi:hypothetical protein